MSARATCPLQAPEPAGSFPFQFTCELNGGVRLQVRAQRRQFRPAVPVCNGMDIQPSGNADQHGVGKARPVGDEIFAVADHFLEPVVTFDHLRTTEFGQRCLHCGVGVRHFHRRPKGAEGSSESRVDERHQLMHPVGVRRSCLEGDPSFRISCFQPGADGHRFRQHVPRSVTSTGVSTRGFRRL